jgi:hypothetical protein
MLGCTAIVARGGCTSTVFNPAGRLREPTRRRREDAEFLPHVSSDGELSTSAACGFLRTSTPSIHSPKTQNQKRRWPKLWRVQTRRMRGSAGEYPSFQVSSQHATLIWQATGSSERARSVAGRRAGYGPQATRRGYSSSIGKGGRSHGECSGSWESRVVIVFSGYVVAPRLIKISRIAVHASKYSECISRCCHQVAHYL